MKKTKYDLCSIMQYGEKAFSMDGKLCTITVKDPKDENDDSCMGSQMGLTVRDGHLVAEEYGRLGDHEGCENGGYRLKGSDDCVCSNLFKGPTCATPKEKGECGETVFKLNAGKAAHFKTPNFPNPYPEGSQCTWVITEEKTKGEENKKVCLGYPRGTKTEGPAEKSNGEEVCYYAWTEVMDSDKRTFRPDRTCGDHGPSYKVYPLRDQEDNPQYWAAIKFDTLSDTYPEQGYEAYAMFVSEDTTDEQCEEKLKALEDNSGSGTPVSPDDTYYGYGAYGHDWEYVYYSYY